jgi:protoporphyrinogen oxidase
MAIAGNKRWSQHVTETSDALTLEQGVFSRDDPRSIARSLKRSAERSERRKSDPYRSAMSMLTFYINRAGKTLPETRKQILENAKDELRKLFGKARLRKERQPGSAPAAPTKGVNS